MNKSIDWNLVERFRKQGRTQEDIAKQLKINSRTIRRKYGDKWSEGEEKTYLAREFYKDDHECDWYFLGLMEGKSKIRVNEEGIMVYGYYKKEK